MWFRRDCERLQAEWRRRIFSHVSRRRTFSRCFLAENEPASASAGVAVDEDDDDDDSDESDDDSSFKPAIAHTFDFLSFWKIWSE